MKCFVKPDNIHLTISTLIVAVVAIVYGFNPTLWFDVKPQTIDEHSILKAISGLYLAFASFWFYAILKTNFWHAATISNSLFMFGLAFGRILSIFTNGIPSTLFLIGTIGELVLGIYSLYQFKKKL